MVAVAWLLSKGLLSKGLGPMGYFILVIGQTIALPIISSAIELAVGGGDPVLVFGKWWVFWGVGTRLLVAGVAQVSGKGPTAAILGAAAPSVQEQQLTRELGVANVGMGLAGLLALVPGWALPAGFAGGVFLLFAGIMHLPKKNKNPQETLATWTDLIVGAAVVVLAAYVLIRAMS
jgi:SPW repeat